MRYKLKAYRIITFVIALVWMVNGLFCKVLNMVPRHEKIVARILGEENAGFLTKAIGISEVFMSVWILSNKKSRLNAATQILIIGTMNGIEFLFASDLLLWGRANAIFAFLFILLIYYNEFSLNKELTAQT